MFIGKSLKDTRQPYLDTGAGPDIDAMGNRTFTNVGGFPWERHGWLLGKWKLERRMVKAGRMYTLLAPTTGSWVIVATTVPESNGGDNLAVSMTVSLPGGSWRTRA